MQDLSKRLTEFADAAVARADMKIKLSKTFSQLVSRREKVDTISEEAVVKKMKSYQFACTYVREGGLRAEVQDQKGHEDPRLQL